jgi:hypothetical protein
MNKVGFLFGAGLSKSVTNIGTMDITKIVLEPNDFEYRANGAGSWTEATDSNWGNEFDREGSKRLKSKIQILLRYIANSMERYYLKQVNYEELFYALHQIKDTAEKIQNNGRTQFDNPFQLQYVNELQKNLEPIFQHIGLDTVTINNQVECTVPHVAGKAIDFVIEIVSRTILKFRLQEGNGNAYSFVTDALNDSCVFCRDIFCLNHDTLLERFFKRAHICFIDGFENVYGIFKWNPVLFKDIDQLKIFKLHGSVDWAYREKTNGNSDTLENDSPYDNFFCKLTDQESNSLNIPKYRLILIGTTNKIIDYTYGLFADLLACFNLRLKELDTLISLGYSFNDHGINAQIISWMFSDLRHRLIIIDKATEEEFLGKAIPHIKNNWDKWKSFGNSMFIRKKIEALTWADLKPRIFNLRKKADGNASY